MTALAVLLVAVQPLFWSRLLQYNWQRAEAAIARSPQPVEWMVIGADFEEYRDYYRQYPTRLNDLQRRKLDNEFYKRPLYGPISAAVSLLLGSLLGIGFPGNMLVTLAIYPTIATVVFYKALRWSGACVPAALHLGALAALSFSWLALFSVPESYSLAACGAAAAILSGEALRRAPENDLRRAAIRHAVVVGLASLLSLPICGAALLVLPRVSVRRQLATLVMPVILVAVAVAVAPQLVGGTVQVQLAYGRAWASLANLASAANWRDVVSSFLFFGLAAPTRDFVFASPAPDWPRILSSGTALAGIAAVIVLYTPAVVRLARGGLGRRVAGAGAWLASLVLFHVIFNPREVLLYTPVPTLVVLYLVGLTLPGEREGVERLPPAAPVPGPLALTATAFVVLINLGSVIGG